MDTSLATALLAVDESIMASKVIQRLGYAQRLCNRRQGYSRRSSQFDKTYGKRFLGLRCTINQSDHAINLVCEA